jgi:hypothetical protein
VTPACARIAACWVADTPGDRLTMISRTPWACIERISADDIAGPYPDAWAAGTTTRAAAKAAPVARSVVGSEGTGPTYLGRIRARLLLRGPG